MLRSTVSVGTTFDVFKSLRNQFPDITVSFCPERSVEGNAVEDCLQLPQIVGGVDDQSKNIAINFFHHHSIPVIKTESSEMAEFCKLIGNVWRDSTFAIANEFSQIASNYRLNIFDALKTINFNYPRANIPLPGPVGGPCLSKDTKILTSKIDSKVLLVSAMRSTNEKLIYSLLDFIFGNFRSNTTLILILGIAFKGKPPTKDTRSSPGKFIYDELSKHYQVNKLDPELDNLKNPDNFNKLQNLLLSSNLIILTTNHSFIDSTNFGDLINKLPLSTKHLIDLWPNSREWKISNTNVVNVEYKDWHKLNEK